MRRSKLAIVWPELRQPCPWKCSVSKPKWYKAHVAVTEKVTISNILNVVAQLQLEFCKKKILNPWPSYKVLIKALFVISLFGWRGPSPCPCSLCASLVTTLFKFYRCFESMHNIALCMQCERWIPVPWRRNYKVIEKSESSQLWLSETMWLVVPLLVFFL